MCIRDRSLPAASAHGQPRAGAFKSSLARETARRGARQLAKRAFLAVMGRKQV